MVLTEVHGEGEFSGWGWLGGRSLPVPCKGTGGATMRTVSYIKGTLCSSEKVEREEPMLHCFRHGKTGNFFLIKLTFVIVLSVGYPFKVQRAKMKIKFIIIYCLWLNTHTSLTHTRVVGESRDIFFS